MSAHARVFALAIADCDALLSLIKGKVDDAMRLDPSRVTQELALASDELHYALKLAATAAGVEVDVL